MVRGHVVSDQPDDLIVVVAAGDVTAFAPDQLRHGHLLSLSGGYCQDVGVALVSPARLRIQVCGPIAVDRDGERLEARLPGRQGRVLLAYLVVNRHRDVPRRELAEALWAEADPSSVDAKLNPLLSKLRSVFGADAVDGRSTVRLQVPDAWVDVEAAVDAIHRAESAITQRDWARAWGPSMTALFVAERDFLAGEDAAWIDDYRRDLDLLHVRALEAYAAATLGIGGTELAGAVRAGGQLIRLAPLRESGYRYLMEALAAQGNLAEAIRVYTRLSDCLRDELGVSPSPASRELYERLLAAT
jgi:DNA-binding SARP family transcriptional activator